MKDEGKGTPRLALAGGGGTAALDLILAVITTATGLTSVLYCPIS